MEVEEEGDDEVHEERSDASRKRMSNQTLSRIVKDVAELLHVKLVRLVDIPNARIPDHINVSFLLELLGFDEGNESREKEERELVTIRIQRRSDHLHQPSEKGPSSIRIFVPMIMEQDGILGSELGIMGIGDSNLGVVPHIHEGDDFRFSVDFLKDGIGTNVDGLFVKLVQIEREELMFRVEFVPIEDLLLTGEFSEGVLRILE